MKNTPRVLIALITMPDNVRLQQEAAGGRREEGGVQHVCSVESFWWGSSDDKCPTAPGSTCRNLWTVMERERSGRARVAGSLQQPSRSSGRVGLTATLAGGHIPRPVEAVCLFNGTWLLRLEEAFSEERVLESQILLDLYNNAWSLCSGANLSERAGGAAEAARSLTQGWCAGMHYLRVTGNLPLHLCSIIWIEAVSYSKWTAVTVHFLAPEAGARIMEHIPFQCFPYSSLHISNYWKWKRVCQSHLNCQFGIFLSAFISPE